MILLPGVLETHLTHIDDEPTAGSENLVKSGGVAAVNGSYEEIPGWIRVITDKDRKILCGIKSDGSIEWSLGVPQPIKDYVREKIELGLDEYENIVTFIGELIEGDTLSELLDNKVDKITGEKLIPAQYIEERSSNDFAEVHVDKDNKILYGVKEDGDFFFGAGVPQQILDVLPEDVGTDIVKLNDVVYTEKALKNLKRPSRSASTVKYTPFVLLHASDIHGDASNLERIVEYNEYYKDYIDDAIISGDIAKGVFEDDIALYRNTQNAQNIMLAIGNHDTAQTEEDVINWYAHVGHDCYKRYIENYYLTWGVTLAGEDKCYYYKDYDAYMIRLIVTDCMDRQGDGLQAQLAWFNGLLNALPEGYSVLCINHYPYYPNVTYANASPHIECSFDSRQSAPVGSGDHIPDEFVSAVDDWLTANNNANAGRFICWLSGHAHTDYVCIAKNTTQLVITIDTASHRSRDIGYSDTERVESKKSQDLFNLVGVDTYQKIIKIMRVGADMDSYMRSKKTMCIQYASNATFTLQNDMPQLIYCN